MTTAERIKELRTEAGLKQSELAEALGCSGQVISNIERGYSSLNLEMLIGLADICHVSADYILGRTEQHQQVLSPVEKELLAYYRSSAPEDQQVIELLVRKLSDRQ